MPYYKKIKPLFVKILFIFCVALPMLAHAEVSHYSIDIKNAELVANDDEYFLNANADVAFNDEILQAILKGFELNFILEFQLALPRKYWFDDEIVTVTYPITLSYHPLSRQYLMTQAGQKKSFASMDEVIGEFANLRHIKVLKKSEVEKGEPYKALLLIRLDYKKLPKAIQIDAVESDAWEMTSQRFEWVPSLFK